MCCVVCVAKLVTCVNHLECNVCSIIRHNYLLFGAVLQGWAERRLRWVKKKEDAWKSSMSMLENEELKKIIDAAHAQMVTLAWIKEQLANIKAQLQTENQEYNRLQGTVFISFVWAVSAAMFRCF